MKKITKKNLSCLLLPQGNNPQKTVGQLSDLIRILALFIYEINKTYLTIKPNKQCNLNSNALKLIYFCLKSQSVIKIFNRDYLPI